MIHPAKRLELFFLSVLPSLVAIVLTVLYLSAKHLSGVNQFMPLLPILPIFYWGMVARDMHYIFVFLIGIILDAVIGMPLGLTSILFMIFLIMVHSQRKFFHKDIFLIKWAYFAVLMAVMSIANWFLLAFFMQHNEPLAPGLLQWLLTTLTYPIFHRIFDSIDNYIHDRRWHILHGQ